MHTALVEVETKKAEKIAESIRPDAEKEKNVEVKVTSEKGKVKIVIRAKKLSYLMATVNSYLSLVKMLDEMEV